MGQGTEMGEPLVCSDHPVQLVSRLQVQPLSEEVGESTGEHN